MAESFDEDIEDRWNTIDCRDVREKLGLSQREFARRFNFPVSPESWVYPWKQET